MIVVNFSRDTQFLKGAVLQSGGNIVSDDLGITEADRSDIIGIGNSDLAIFEVLKKFYENETFFYNDTKIIDTYKNVARLKKIIKAEVNQKNNSATIDKNRDLNIIDTNKRIKSYQKRISVYFSHIKLKPIENDKLKELDMVQFEIQDSNFYAVQKTLEFIAEIKKTKKQVLSYDLQAIRQEYAVN